MSTAEGSGAAAAARISQVLEEAEIFVAVVYRDGQMVLEGEVESQGTHGAALDVAHAVADPLGIPVIDNLERMDFVPDSDLVVTSEADDDRWLSRSGQRLLDADFSDAIGTGDPSEATQEGIPYFPPTDPVVRPSNDAESLEILGGFESTSMDDEPRDADYGLLDDGEIVEIVERELREDSLTTTFKIEVISVNGVVHLQGTVETMEDAENVEAVANRVEGVREVRENLHVRDIERQRER